MTEPEWKSLPLGSIDDALYNPRTMSRPQRAGLRASLGKWRLVQNLVVNHRTTENGWPEEEHGRLVMVSGHRRREELVGMDETEAMTAIVELNQAEEEALNLALNNPEIAGDFTADVKAVLDRVQKRTPETFSALNFSHLREVQKAAERAKARAASGTGAQNAARRLVEGQRRATNRYVCDEVVSKPGEVYELGPHRIAFGSSVDADFVDYVLEGRRPELLCTDPPYGVKYGQHGSGKKNSILGDQSQSMIPLMFAVFLEERLDDDARLYLCGGYGNYEMYRSLWDHYIHDEPRVIVWAKEGFVMRPVGYHSQTEFIYWGWKGKGGGPAYWYSDRKGENASDLWQIPRERAYIHPTEKPVELNARAIRNSLRPGGLVVEPFAGSGSTLIAAAQEGRVCYAFEKDGRFVDAIRRRWTDFCHTHELDPGPGALELLEAPDGQGEGEVPGDA